MSGSRASGPGGFRPRRLAHANIFVTNLQASVPFYRDLCGLREVFQEPGIKAVFFSNGSSHHDVALMEIDRRPRIGRDGHVQVSSGRGREAGLNHLGFEMENERLLVAAYRRLREAGVDIHRTTDHGMSHSVYLFDPEGNLLEFYADAVKDWRAFYRARENQLISGHWSPGSVEPSDQPLYGADFVADPVPGAAVRPKRIACASLLVNDLERMRRFYEEVAGLTVLNDRSDSDHVVLAGLLGEPTVALHRAAADERPGLHHLSFELLEDDDPVRAADRFRKHGAARVRCFESSAGPALMVRDPDGLRLVFCKAVVTESRTVPGEPEECRLYSL